MVYKRFVFSVGIRVGLLLANLVILAFLFARSDLFFNEIILFLLLIFQTYDLVRCTTQTNRELARFLSALQYGEYSVHFSSHRDDPSFVQLYQAFGQVLNSYQRVRVEKQSQLQYLELILTHLNAGIIILSDKEEVAFLNSAAKETLQIPHVEHWRQIKALQPYLVAQVDTMIYGGRTLVEITTRHDRKPLSVQVTAVTVLGKPYRLITFQDIKSEIEQKETEAWYQLIRVLTHEIMNSVTPICSMTETATMLLEDVNGNQKRARDVSEETISDIRFSLKTITKRSEGMLHFVENYQKLSKIPQPQLTEVPVSNLFASVSHLMQGETFKNGVTLQIDAPQPDLTIRLDIQLIEQVFINLIQNSLDALKQVPAPTITLSCLSEGNTTVVEVTDNGTGIDADKLTKIFMPFYSTKPEGLGIGLSLCRQIMRLHRGSLTVSSEKGVKTSFQLRFPAN